MVFSGLLRGSPGDSWGLRGGSCELVGRRGVLRRVLMSSLWCPRGILGVSLWRSSWCLGGTLVASSRRPSGYGILTVLMASSGVLMVTLYNQAINCGRLKFRGKHAPTLPCQRSFNPA